MRKRCKSRTKPIMLTILICFVTVNVFPYDIIGIMIEDSKENAELKDAYLLVRKGYEESLDSLGKYEVIRESEEEEFYLLKRGGLTEEGIDSMYKELNGKDYNNIFMLDTPDYSGEFNIQKGKLHRAGNRDLIVNTTATVLLAASTILGLAVTDTSGFAQTDKSERINILLLTIPYAILSGIAMFQSIRDIKVKNKKPESAESIYDDFMRGMQDEENGRRYLNALEIFLVSSALVGLSIWVSMKYADIQNLDDYGGFDSLPKEWIAVISYTDFVSGLVLLNQLKTSETISNKYYLLGKYYE